jgi:hypothetical protein
MTGRQAWRTPIRAWLPAAVAMACALQAVAALARPPGPAKPVAGDTAITGRWASIRGAERIEFTPDGRFRTCMADGRRGNAALGLWRRQAPGRYLVEFTHTAAPDCGRPAQALRQHPASIVGQALLSPGELALYVSGEFPPDLYRPVAPVAAGR